MCGIAGIVNPPGVAADPVVLARMLDTIRHRGPDAEGIHVDGNVGLGHRRLSIIDVEGGAQPMPNEDGSAWIAYNGELYNDPALRARLLKLGHDYRTRCDTESIVHLYDEVGDDFAAQLNGMFALAIWDRARGRLVLARDRLGQKPLYHATTRSGAFVFASEAKAILAHPEVAREVDPDGVARYLFYEYLPDPHSIFRGVNKLPPGHLMVVDAGTSGPGGSGFGSGAKVSATPPRPYWRYPEPGTERLSGDEASARVWALLVDAVDRHRRSDVPLGVFLSGGVDSSAVVAALRECAPGGQIDTFAIRFDDPSFDESRHARLVADELGTAHHARRFDAGDVLRMVPALADWLDEPFGDASVLPTRLLSEFARERVTVALGGDGADELLGGYPTFGATEAARLYRELPGAVHRGVDFLAGRLPVGLGNFSLDFKVKQFLRGARESPSLAHQRWLGSFGGAEIVGLLAEPPRVDVELERERSGGLDRYRGDPLDSVALLRMYQRSYLPGDILTKVDRASMSTSLEVRAPFLDAPLVDFVEGLPASVRSARFGSKALLKRALRGKVPASILRRPKKGFGIPVARWLRGPLRPLMLEKLDGPRLARQGIFRPDAVAKLVGEHDSGAADRRKPLWTLLAFQLWHDRWMGGR